MHVLAWLLTGGGDIQVSNLSCSKGARLESGGGNIAGVYIWHEPFMYSARTQFKAGRSYFHTVVHKLD